MTTLGSVGHLGALQLSRNDAAQRWEVRGKTFKVRDELKALGLRWDAKAKVWYTKDGALAAELGSALAGLERRKGPYTRRARGVIPGTPLRRKSSGRRATDARRRGPADRRQRDIGGVKRAPAYNGRNNAGRRSGDGPPEALRASSSSLEESAQQQPSAAPQQPRALLAVFLPWPGELPWALQDEQTGEVVRRFATQAEAAAALREKTLT